MNDIKIRRPWYVAFAAETPERVNVPTAIEDALRRAVEKALYDPQHALHRQTFGYYRAHAPGTRHRAGRRSQRNG